MSRVIAVVSQKGGVGKTSLVQNLGAELAALGQRVLMVDFDPQSNLTMAWGIDPSAPRPTVYDALLDPARGPAVGLALRPGLTLWPATLDLVGAETAWRARRGGTGHEALRQALAAPRGDHDVVLLDAPPALGFFTVNALLAATEVLVPLQVQGFAYRALDQLLAIIEQARHTNPALRLLGLVLTMYDRRLTLTKTVEEVARRRFGDLIFHTVVPVNVRIAEASLQGLNVGALEAGSQGAVAYRALAEEVLSRG